MVSEDIDSYYCMIELWVGRLKNFVVSMFFIVQGIQSLEHEFKHSAKILGWRRSYKDVAKPIHNRRGDRYSKWGRLTAAPTSG